MTRPFSERLSEAILATKCPLIVGLDPRLSSLPDEIQSKWKSSHGLTFEAAAAAVLEFNLGILEAIADLVPAVKPQLAFYEQLGVPGLETLEKTIAQAKKLGLLVLADGKRNDIGSTAAGYADAYLGTSALWEKSERPFPADALTVNPYLGTDGVAPLVEASVKHGTGIFVLVKTSNPSSSELQNLDVGGKKVYEVVGELCHKWGLPHVDKRGYSPVGAVVGATYPREAEVLREIMPNSYFLVPGFGAQGGGPKDVVPCFNRDGLGAIVNSSRDVIFAYQKRGGDYRSAARKAVIESRDAINTALGEAGKVAW